MLSEMRARVKRLLLRVFSRKTSCKLYYKSSLQAIKAHNALVKYFACHKKRFMLLGSDIIDDYWNTEGYYIQFKFIELEGNANPALSLSDLLNELERAANA